MVDSLCRTRDRSRLFLLFLLFPSANDAEVDIIKVPLATIDRASR